MASERREFLKKLQAFAVEQRLLIEAECPEFAAGEKDRIARLARIADDFKFFCKIYFPHYIKSEASIFQDYIYKTLPGIIDNPAGHNEVIAAPRGEAKSTLITQLFNLWCIITERKKFPVIIMDAFDQAAMMLEAIKAELEFNPRLKTDYPAIVGAGRVWQAGVIVTKNNVKIQVAGAAKKIRGWRHGPHRPDLVILDDIENDENVKSKAQRDKLQNWLRRAVMKMGPPDGSMDIIYVGTVMHYDSVLNRTLKSPTWHGKLFKSIIRWPDNMDMWESWEEILINRGEKKADQFYEQNKVVMNKGAVVSWPDTRALVMLMKIRADDHRAFDSEMQNDPGNDENAPFKVIQFWVKEDNAWIFFGAVDPSLGKRNRSRDPSAILVGGFNRTSGVLDVVEASIARRVPDKIITDTIEFQRIYKCLVWGIEAVQFQEFFFTELIKRSAAAGVPVPARALVPHTDKNLRIESLQPHVANGLIRLHQTQSTMIEQLRYWPEADHDDGPDALQMLYMLAVSGAGGVPQIRSGRMNIKERLAYA